MAKTTKVNPHTGSSFDDFLKEDGIYEEVQARALTRVAMLSTKPRHAVA